MKALLDAFGDKGVWRAGQSCIKGNFVSDHGSY
jgi:hypothetical protein